MATMNKVIEHVDRMNPNVFTDDDKYEWIRTLEGLVAHEVLQEEAPAYHLPDDADVPLLVQAPYDDIYRLYVTSMIYLHNREYDHYNNAVLVFQQRYEQYKAWYIQNHATCKALNFRNVMG
jgi:hypothetical protein